MEAVKTSLTHTYIHTYIHTVMGATAPSGMQPVKPLMSHASYRNNHCNNPM